MNITIPLKKRFLIELFNTISKILIDQKFFTYRYYFLNIICNYLQKIYQ